ncbi:Sec-independent protein translocase subunit TatB [Pseudomonas putida]|uniref:Sec-independent protein translocase protein TatB n=1 Tax=Pseudomonas putida TaxID=303 RepID=UPI001A8E6910|nr:Sec-independent protein translocase protein TatB [Pseudomonas putida]MBO0367136.1 Sec-independent protein translocase subunit TatB [Pseudomonas putida]
MFGISFSELLLVGLVALVVLGPERLPGAARTAGLWIGRLKRSFNSIKMEVEREIGADDIRRQLHNEHILSMEQEARRILNPQAEPPKPAQPPLDAGTPIVPLAEPAAAVQAPTAVPAEPSTPVAPAAIPEPPQTPRAP